MTMTKPELSYLESDAVETEYGRIRLCWAFMNFQAFYHQEIAVLNPDPVEYDPDYLLPRDQYVLTHHVDLDGPAPQLEELLQLVQQYKTPMICIGSHTPQSDRTLQLICLPPDYMPAGQLPARMHLIVQYLIPLTESEREEIVNTLLQAYSQVSAD